MRNTARIAIVLTLFGTGFLASALATTHPQDADFPGTPASDVSASVDLRNLDTADEAISFEQRDLRRFIEDAAINAAVKTVLLFDETTGRLNISVKTHRGIVRLSGEVESEAQRNYAVSVAISARGVYGVNDTHLKVKGS